jgi:predicted nucleic acid-binding protein
VILLDTSALIHCLTGRRRSARALRRAIESGERAVLSTIVLYEWLRGPRVREELAAQEALFPRETALAFGAAEAAKAAELCRSLAGARGREIDLAIAASAICWDARLWTVNVGDFEDIPGLELFRPA